MKTVECTRYDPVTGALFGNVTTTDQLIEQSTHSFIEGTYDTINEYYDINEQTVKPRVELTGTSMNGTTFNQGDTVIISGLPIPCTLTVRGLGEVEVDDGSLEIDTSDAVGQFAVILKQMPYLTKKFLYEVV